MILYHNGEIAPFYQEKVNPNDREPFWVSWVWKIGDDVIITNSEWILPAGFAVVESIENSIAEDDCDEYTRSNGIVFSTSHTSGQHQIDNKMTYLSKDENGDDIEFTLTRGFRFELGFI